jgi:hypothetical protein
MKTEIAVLKSGKTLDRLLEAQGVDENEVVADFNAVRKEATQPNKPNAKQVITRVVIVIALLSIAGIAIQYTPMLVAFALTAFFSFAGIRSFLRRAQSARLASKWQLMRFVRQIRRSFGASPAALALYAACFGTAGIAMSLLILTKSPSVFAVFASIVGVLLCIATFLDWYVRLKYILSIEIVRQSAKLVVVFLATTTAFFSTVLAKQLTHSLAQADPSSMPEFVRLVSAFVFPFALSAVLSVALTLVMIAQYAALLVGLLVTTPVKYMVASTLPSMRARLDGILYRILNGKKPPKHRPWGESLVDGVQHFLRPIGTGAIAGLVIILGLAVAGLAGHIPGKYLQALLVKTEYRSPHLCENVPPFGQIAYLQDGYVSVATPQDEGYIFSVTKCHK